MPDLRRQLEEQIKKLKQVQERVAEAGEKVSEGKEEQSRKSPAASTSPISPTS